MLMAVASESEFHYSAAPTFGLQLSNRLSNRVSNSMEIIPLRAKNKHADKHLICLKCRPGDRNHKTDSGGCGIKLSNHDSDDAPPNS